MDEEIKYAVYIIVMEDSNDADMAVWELYPVNMDRVGDLSEDAALDLAAEAGALLR